MYEFKEETGSFFELARQYLNLLLNGDNYAAVQMIMEAVKNNIDVKDIYLHVFEPSQHEIGRLWQKNQISIAQEHFCTAVTQNIMSQLYPHIYKSEKNGYKMITTCVSGELHEIGARMVSDFFEMEGWDTYYLGANMSTKSIIETIIELKPDLILISATINSHVGAVADLIKQIRSLNVKNLKIIVGGRLFNISPPLWEKVGADCYASNALESISVAKKLLNIKSVNKEEF
jgi:methanogenic corrinoid protein MtbC1